MKSKINNVEIYHRINKLKKKAGIAAASGATGFIPSDVIESAQESIDQKEAEYPAAVKELIQYIEETWKSVAGLSGEEQAKAIESIYNYANNIKDLTSTYEHDLMHHFSLSLRNFCDGIDLNKKAHHTIFRAHLDVMWVTYEERLRSDETAQAEELKKVLQIAIDKYS